MSLDNLNLPLGLQVQSGSGRGSENLSNLKTSTVMDFKKSDQYCFGSLCGTIKQNQSKTRKRNSKKSSKKSKKYIL
jgi:hypothetical protein